MRQCLVYILLIALGMQAFAQVDSPQAPMRDQEALRLLNSALASMTTPSASPVKDFVITGNLLKWGSKTVNAPVIIQGTGLDSLRFEATLPGGTFLLTKTLATGAINDTAEKSVEPIPIHKLAETNPFFFIPALFEAANSGTTSVTYEGVDNYFDAATHHLRIIRQLPPNIDPGGYLSRFTKLDVYVDTDSNRVVRVERLLHDSTNASDHVAVPEVWEYSDYHPDAGWIVPHLITKSFPGMSESMRLSISTYTFNAGVMDAAFLGQ
jgi:hypothetical protein